MASPRVEEASPLIRVTSALTSYQSSPSTHSHLHSCNSVNSPASIASVANSTPITLKSPRFFPSSSSISSTPGRSPLRSCHNKDDAVHHLRRLTTATFPTSPQVNAHARRLLLLSV
jgi:hypothetical protein